MTPIPENPLEDPVNLAPDYTFPDWVETISYPELVASPLAVTVADSPQTIPLN